MLKAHVASNVTERFHGFLKIFVVLGPKRADVCLRVMCDYWM